MKFRTIYLALAIIPVILVIIFILNNNNNIPFLTNKKEFDLNIDALKEEQSLFTHTRVTITNTGKQPLTDIKVDYGNKTETVKSLEPGQSYPLSPPAGSDLQKIIVTSEQGINITKEYRTPIKMPGMMGS
jgi:archaellum component FlaF (FlaF/FlaG flagellin family)